MPVNQLNSHNRYIGGNFTSFGAFLATNQYQFYLLENLQSLSNFEKNFYKIFIQLRIKFLCKKGCYRPTIFKRMKASSRFITSIYVL